MLSIGSAARLVLLVAPAGYGKSVAAAALAREHFDAQIIEGLSGGEALEEAVSRLWSVRPAARAIVCSRLPLRVPFNLAMPHEVRLVRANELRLQTPLDALDAITRGWPVAVSLAHARAEEVGMDAALAELAALANPAFAQYIDDEVLPSLTAEARRLLLLAHFGPLALGAMEMLLGNRLAAALDEIDGSFLERGSEGTYQAHPLIRTAVAARHLGAACAVASELAAAYDPAVQPLRAARWYLRAGNAHAAAGAYQALRFSRIAEYTSEDSNAAAQLDQSALVENLAVFDIAAVEQLYVRDHERWFAMAKEAMRRAPPSIDPLVRVGVLLSLIMRMCYFARFDEVRGILDEQHALLGEIPQYAPALHFSEAYFRVTQDAFVDLGRLREELGPLLLDARGRILFASIASYTHGVQGDWPSARSEWELMIEANARAQRRAQAAEVLMGAAFFAWLYGDDERFSRWCAAIEALHVPDGTAIFERCVRAGTAAPGGSGYETLQSRVYGYLIAGASATDAGEARWFARHALADAGRTGRPFFAVLAHIALALLGAADADEHFSKACTLAEKVNSTELQRAARAVARADEDTGMLAHFCGRYVRERRGGGLLAVNLIGGTIEWEGTPLSLNERPRDVLLALAFAEKPLRGEELAERIWPERDPAQMQNALRVHIAAIRKASDASVISYEAGRYRVIGTRALDLEAAERLVRRVAHELPLGEPIRGRLQRIAQAIERREEAACTGEWFEPIERRLQSLRRTAILTLGEDALLQGDAAAAIGYARSVIDRDACDERARSIAIRAHLQKRDQAEALREYREYRRSMRTELGIDLFGDAADDEALQAFVSATGRR